VIAALRELGLWPGGRERRDGRSPNGRNADPLDWVAGYCGVPPEFVRSLPLAAEGTHVAFRFGGLEVRKLRPVGAKSFFWIPSGGATPPLWPLPGPTLPDCIYLVEGETDCIVALYVGLNAYAMTHGAKGTLTAEQASALNARGVERAVVVFDVDRDGKEGSTRLAEVLRQAGVEAAVANLDALGLVDPLAGQKDLRDAWLACRDRETLRTALEEAIHVSRSRHYIGGVNRESANTPSWQLIEVASRPEPAPRLWLLPELLPCKCLSIWYGDAGTFKSYLAVALAVAKAGGLNFLGYALEPGPALFVDSELDDEEFTRRAYGVARGFGLSTPPKGLYYLRLPASLAEAEAALRLQTVAGTCKAELVIVDSLTYASLGADLKEASDTSRVLSALIGLGTVLVIDHIAKPLPGANLSQYRPYGSFAKWALGRHIVQVLRAETGCGVVLRPAKTNFGPLGPPVGVAISFDAGVVRIRRTDLSDEALAGIEDDLPAMERVARALGGHSVGATPAELAGDLGVSEGRVRNLLTALRKQGRAAPDGDGRWRLLTIYKQREA